MSRTTTGWSIWPTDRRREAARADAGTRVDLGGGAQSGIVTRVERRGQLQRTPRPDDRRYVSIELTKPVREWVEHDLRAARLSPLAAAIAEATEERAAIRNGLATLQRLVARQTEDGGRRPTAARER